MRDVPAKDASERGLRVLVAEDSALLAIEVEDVLSELGLEVVGPVGSITAALESIKASPPDAALLDVNLHDGQVYPVARELRRRKIPFLFLTGFGRCAISPAYLRYEVLEKPVDTDSLQEAVEQLLTNLTAAH